MKKMIIMACAIIGAVAANAATFEWKTATGQNLYLPGSTSSTTMTAYLFNSDALSQQALLTAFDTKGSIDTTKALSSATTSAAGKISATTFNYGAAGDTLNAYLAVVTAIEGQDYLFISEIASDVAPTTGNGSLTFREKTASQAVATEFAPGSATFGGTGWYTAAVPEPTSGLLMLLGMAGLALRRRRA